MNFAKALAAHRKGQFSEAEVMYREILGANPTDFNAMHLLGVIALQTGRTAHGVELIRAAVRLNENMADAHLHLGNGLRDLKILDEALTSYDRAIALNSNHADAFNNRGMVLWELQRPDEALASFDQAIALRPDYFQAHCNRGDTLRKLHRLNEALSSYRNAVAFAPTAESYNSCGLVLLELDRFSDALASFDQAIAVEPRDAGAYTNRGVTLVKLQRPLDALESYDAAIALKPGQAEAHNNRGYAFWLLMRVEEALEAFDRAISLRQGYFDAFFNRGNMLRAVGRAEEALSSYDAAVTLRADHADVHNNRGIALWDLKRGAEALENYNRAVELNPAHAEAYNNRGAILLELARYDEALENLNKAILLKPDYVDAYLNRGKAFAMNRQFDKALVAYDYLFRLDRTLPGVEGHRLHAKMQLCDWENIENEAESLIRSVRAGLETTQPFFFLAMPSTAQDQLQCSRSWVANNFPRPAKQAEGGEEGNRGRIHVAYVSADFRHHPMSYLTAGLFECHDKSRFEITAISLAPEEHSEIHRRLKASFERFIYAEAYTDDQLVGLLKSLRIDILVDLMGFTTGARTAIFARRPAPVQISYLGYPGTMGAPFIDYIVADRVVIPEDHRRFYAENVVFLPDSYWVNDSRRVVAGTRFSREELGLPTSFVFCCFNNSYKISPRIFDSWMRILKQVPDAVIWLLETSGEAVENLKKEAGARGIDPDRLVFAKQMPPVTHLARLRAADLCLDTLPYNAHTTASDALWVGTPVLTCLGDTFAGRVAASMLYALQLPELITKTMSDYERLAIELATEPQKLADINRRLANNLETTSLFDTKTFAGNFERAFCEMIQRYRTGSVPADIYISSRPISG